MKKNSIPAMGSASCNSTLANQLEPQDSHGVWLSDFFFQTTWSSFGFPKISVSKVQTGFF
jgi:hypothetical protein